MSTFRHIAFYAIGTALAAALLFMTWNWNKPITFLLSGKVFSWDFQYVANENSYGGGDGFRVAVNRMFLIFLFLTVVLIPLLALWRAIASPFAGLRRGLYLVLGSALSVLPVAAALVATIMVTRLTIDMGITPKRLLGIAIGVACVMVFPLFLHVSGKRVKSV